MSKRCCVIGRSKTCGSSASPTAGASWAWVTWAPTAWGYRSASCSSTPQRPASRRKGCCRCISTPGPTTSNTCGTRSTWVCARRGPRQRSCIRSSTSSSRPCRRFFRTAASTSRTGPVWTRCICCSGIATYCVYNDDVQGTAGITLAGMINATRLKGAKLQDEKYLFLGAGSAAIGLAGLLCTALVEQGMTLDDARAKVHMFDINGLLEPSRTDLVDFQRPYAHPHSPTKDFVEAVKSIRPTTIIGVSTIGGAFTQQVVEAMSEINERPVILALSNPTDHAECTPEQAYSWSKGKAIYAAGVQFPPVHLDGQTFLPGQANNFYIFPAIGMAIFATQAKRVT